MQVIYHSNRPFTINRGLKCVRKVMELSNVERCHETLVIKEESPLDQSAHLNNHFYNTSLQGSNSSILFFQLESTLKEKKIATLQKIYPFNPLYTGRLFHCYTGWSGGAMVLGKLPVPGRPTVWIGVGQGPTALAVGAGGGCLDIFTLIYPFSPLSPSLWETARYRLKYCLKGPLNTKQPTNQPLLYVGQVHLSF